MGWKPEDSMEKLVFSFQHVGPRALGLGDRYLYQLNMVLVQSTAFSTMSGISHAKPFMYALSGLDQPQWCSVVAKRAVWELG